MYDPMLLAIPKDVVKALPVIRTAPPKTGVATFLATPTEPPTTPPTILYVALYAPPATRERIPGCAGSGSLNESDDMPSEEICAEVYKQRNRKNG